MIKFPLTLLAVLAISCNNPITSNDNSAEDKQADNKVEQPKNLKLHELPSELAEISGITFLTDNIVLGVQDEEGILYQYDLAEQKIINEFKFGKSGDYEDLVRINKDVYIVSSNGSIIQIRDFQSAEPLIKTFKTALSKDNDIEGLGYEPKKNRLLLAAKAKGLDEDENTKEVYAFNLSTMTLDTTPAYTIKLDEIEKYFKGDALVESSKKFLKALGNRNINKVFRSSAITVDPSTNNIFVLSSINNLIAVITPQGELSQIIQFDGKEHKQPEGLAFSENGKLYISNEAGNSGKSNIIELEYAN